MNAEMMKVVGAAAGVIGVIIALVIILFRDIIRINIFPQLTKIQAYRILLLIIVFAFGIGCLGIYAWFEKDMYPRVNTTTLSIYRDSIPWRFVQVEIPEKHFSATTNAVGDVKIPRVVGEIKLLIGKEYLTTQFKRGEREKKIYLKSPKFKQTEIAGVILKDGVPMAGVELITELGDSTQTDKLGQFRFYVRSGIDQDKIILTYSKEALIRRAVVQVNQSDLTLDL